tara:strand:- start:4043 stop:5590 length:1548 start_codon:yes stop_codon:yes gene_type:complete
MLTIVGNRLTKCGDMTEKRVVILCFPETEMEMPGAYQLPLGILSVAAPLAQEYDVVIYDQRVDAEDKYVSALERNPIAVGISSMTGAQLHHGIALSHIAHEFGVPTIWGNWHPTLLPEQTVAHDAVDYVITREGEEAMTMLVRQIERQGKVEQKIWNGMVTNWDAIPDIPYHLVDMEHYMFNPQYPHKRVSAFTFSRGCPFQCAYCATGNLNRKWATFQVDNAVRRMMHLVDTYDVEIIKFTDENITTNKKVFMPLAEAIDNQFGWMIQSRIDCISRNDVKTLQKNGLRLMSSGLESGSDRILKLIKKKETVQQYIDGNKLLATTDIRVSYNFMMAFPGETWDDVLASVQLGMRLIKDNSNAFLNPFYTFVPYPGCSLSQGFEDRMPTDLEGWSEFDRFNAHTPFSREYQYQISNIAFSSKFVGKRFMMKFPENQKVLEFTEILRRQWERLDFVSPVWEEYREYNRELMHELFGNYAFDGIMNARQKDAKNQALQRLAEMKLAANRHQNVGANDY